MDSQDIPIGADEQPRRSFQRAGIVSTSTACSSSTPSMRTKKWKHEIFSCTACSCSSRRRAAFRPLCSRHRKRIDESCGIDFDDHQDASDIREWRCSCSSADEQHFGRIARSSARAEFWPLQHALAAAASTGSTSASSSTTARCISLGTACSCGSAGQQRFGVIARSSGEASSTTAGRGPHRRARRAR